MEPLYDRRLSELDPVAVADFNRPSAPESHQKSRFPALPSLSIPRPQFGLSQYLQMPALPTIDFSGLTLPTLFSRQDLSIPAFLQFALKPDLSVFYLAWQAIPRVNALPRHLIKSTPSAGSEQPACDCPETEECDEAFEVIDYPSPYIDHGSIVFPGQRRRHSFSSYFDRDTIISPIRVPDLADLSADNSIGQSVTLPRSASVTRPLDDPKAGLFGVKKSRTENTAQDTNESVQNKNESMRNTSENAKNTAHSSIPQADTMNDDSEDGSLSPPHDMMVDTMDAEFILESFAQGLGQDALSGGSGQQQEPDLVETVLESAMKGLPGSTVGADKKATPVHSPVEPDALAALKDDTGEVVRIDYILPEDSSSNIYYGTSWLPTSRYLTRARAHFLYWGNYSAVNFIVDRLFPPPEASDDV